ncbi:ABC transporter substrate-binding protein [Agromyces atrinae]|uniref:Iron complex transport system substrate-binding protein n=1 Tax=Agromyces atrinae TaxID=592376 RepID=A0A4Q2M8H1_9MICO|nr:iron-siderophore ABC transporter substrate-binding protein [Agromyces atrinae]NYD66319.1 iron complex transport system substrate-binding protein [Agromyces atrinae]RXZ86643.1 iron-siderophore ABC transporter substrate-binding protein [Agromyces atrinae]
MPRRALARTVLSSLALVGAVALTACSTAAPEADTAPTTASSASETRVFTHAHGETEIPTSPQRIVVLEPVQLDTAVALGATPVGAAVLNETAGVPAYLGDDAADIEMVGTVAEPSVERIAALAPDLILGTESRHSALYDQLSAVAPTVFMATQSDPWQENVAFVADALGDPDGASELLSAYEERCDEIAEEFGTEGSTAQLIRPRDGILTLYGPTSFAGSTLECAGFTTPERAWEDISLDVSPENVVDASADLVLVTTTDVDDPTTLPAAISDNAAVFPDVHLVDQSFWITGVGPLGGMTVLDDLERILSTR